MSENHTCIQEVPIALLQKDIDNIMQKLTSIEKKIDKFIQAAEDTYLTKKEHSITIKMFSDRVSRMEKIIYATIAVLWSGVVGAILKLILK